MELKTFSRYNHYDYSRGASLFVTLHLSPRIPVFGRVTSDGFMNLSNVGYLLQETILNEQQRNHLVQIKRFRIMPEHLHLRTYLMPEQKLPLKLHGQMLSNIKRWSIFKAKKIGVDIAWQKNYHDRLCLSREIIERVDTYIEQNPQKWALMHTDDPPMKVIEPINSPLLPITEWWKAVGNLSLLQGRINSIQLSRNLPMQNAEQIISQLLNEARYAIPMSTFISPMEQKLYNALKHYQLPLIRVVPDTIEHVYRPTVNETPLFIRNKLLLLSCYTPCNSREYAWHHVNEQLAKIALNSGGKAIYLHN